MSRQILTVLGAVAILLLSAGAGTKTVKKQAVGVDESLKIGASVIKVHLAPGLPLPKATVLKWVTLSAEATAAFFDGFPAREAQLTIGAAPRGDIQGGVTFGSKPPRVRIALGPDTTEADLKDDWVLTHEFTHIAMPSVPDEHHWLEEGMASYVEPLGRILVGTIGAEEIWSDLVDGLPKGLPEEGDKGLDFTPTWGRTYWGGALFCLIADIEIRKATAMKHGLVDALRAITKNFGNIVRDAPIREVLKAGDVATGTSALIDTYERMRAAPAPVDLDALWKELGVGVKNGSVSFDDNAPLARVRRSITASKAVP